MGQEWAGTCQGFDEGHIKRVMISVVGKAEGTRDGYGKEEDMLYLKSLDIYL